MSDDTELSRGARQFIDDMTAAGAPARLDGPRILYEVLAVDGALKGQTITTGVSISEVQNWPAAPPHWIHLHGSVQFPATNSDTTDCLPGWLRHSRQYSYTDTAIPPARAWLSHVRGFISIATTQAV